MLAPLHIEKTKWIHLEEEDEYPANQRTEFLIRLLTHRELVEARVQLADLTSEGRKTSVSERATALADYYCNRLVLCVQRIKNYRIPGGEDGPEIADPKGVYDFAWNYMTVDQVLEIVHRASVGSSTVEKADDRKNE